MPVINEISELAVPIAEIDELEVRIAPSAEAGFLETSVQTMPRSVVTVAVLPRPAPAGHTRRN